MAAARRNALGSGCGAAPQPAAVTSVRRSWYGTTGGFSEGSAGSRMIAWYGISPSKRSTGTTTWRANGASNSRSSRVPTGSPR